MSSSSISSIDRALSGAITLGQSGLGSNGSEGILHISQSSNNAGVSPSDCLGSISRASAEMQPTGFLQYLMKSSFNMKNQLLITLIKSVECKIDTSIEI